MKTSKLWRGGAATAALATAALVLTGCGGPAVESKDPAPASGDATESDQKGADAGNPWEGVEPAKEINFWTNHPGGSIDTEKALIEKFTAETGIKVNQVTAGANYEEVAQKFQTAQVGGDAGDLVVLSDATWFPQYLAGSITPIDEILAAANEDPSTYVPALYSDYLYEDQHYAVPYARSTPLFYYNKDHYAQAGITEAPTTWDEVRENSQKMKDAGVTATGFGFSQDSEYPAWKLANLVWGYGGAWSDKWDLAPLTGPETVEALTFAQDMVNNGLASVISGPPATAFGAGAASQITESTGSLKGILDTAEFEVGAAFLPDGPNSGGEGIVPTGGAGLAIAANSAPDRQLAAAMLATYMTNAENTAIFSEATGYLPVRTDADMSDYYVENPLFQVAVEQLALTRSQDYARVFIPGGDKALSSALQSILANGSEVQSTLESARTEIQTNFDRDLKSKVEGS